MGVKRDYHCLQRLLTEEIPGLEGPAEGLLLGEIEYCAGLEDLESQVDYWFPEEIPGLKGPAP